MKPPAMKSSALVTLRIPYLCALSLHRDAMRVVAGRFQRGRLYVAWFIGFGRHQCGGWWPKVSA